MVDYELLRTNNWKLQKPEQEPEEDQEEQPVVVDFVYNNHEERNGRTVAIKILLQLPLNA
jgi:hypothetical protein